MNESPLTYRRYIIDQRASHKTLNFGCFHADSTSAVMSPVGFEPTPFRTGALSQRLRPLGQSVSGHLGPSLAIVPEAWRRVPV